MVENFIKKCTNIYRKYVNIFTKYVNILMKYVNKLINYCSHVSYLSNFILCPSLVRALTSHQSFTWSKHLYPDFPVAIINQGGKGIIIFINRHNVMNYSTFARILRFHLDKSQSYVGIFAVVSDKCNYKVYV